MRFQNRPTAQRLTPDSPRSPRMRERAPARTGFINTKVVGVKPRGTPEADAVGEHRQKVLEYILRAGQTAFDGNPPEYWLKLVEEPTNPYDPDAIKVMLHSRESEARGRREGIHIGHIANGERICTNPTCGAEYEKPLSSSQAVIICTACGNPTRRDGLASQLKANAARAQRTVEDYYNIYIAWDAGGITGTGVQTHGCNIRIQART